MEIIIFLAVILLLGTLSSILALKLNVSNVFFLVFIGMVLGIIGVVEFSREAIITISTISLIFIIFNSVSKFKFNELMKHSSSALKLAIIFLALSLVGLTYATLAIFDLNTPILALLFVSLMSEIDPAIVLEMMKGKKTEIGEILEIESIINSPIAVIIPLTLLNILSSQGGINYLQATEQLVPFLQQFMVAIGVGVVSGAIIVSVLKKTNLGNVSYIVLISLALISYVLADIMHGNGVLSVTIFGLIFGNYHIKKKLELEHFTKILSDALEIIVFILIGTIIFVPFDISFLLKGTLLFIIYLIVRFISVQLSLKKFKFREKLFMSLNVPKGIGSAVIILIITSGSYNVVENIELILNLCLLFILYGIVLSTITTRFADFFLKYSGDKNIKKI